MKKIILAGAVTAALALFTAVAPTRAQQSGNDQVLFGVTFFQNQLITIDTTTGVGTLVGSLGENVGAYGLTAYQGKLYTFNSSDNTLDQVSRLNGQIVERIDIGLSGVAGEGDLAIRSDTGIGFIASAFDAQGNPTHPLYTFDVNAATPALHLTDTGVVLDGLAFDENHTLYAVSQGEAGSASARAPAGNLESGSTLYIVNQTTGALTTVGSLGVSQNSPVAGLTFAPDGTLFGAIDDRLYRINKSTGAATLVEPNTPDFSFSSVSGLAFSTGESALANMASRANVGTGDNVLISGFILRADSMPPTATMKTLIVRAIGPSLEVAGQPLPGALADPTLTLYNQGGTQIAFNDDWKDNTAADQMTIVDSGLAPTNDHESVIVAKVVPGNYTAIVRGANNGTGIGLAELYDIEAGNGISQVNLSARGLVGTGDDVLIAGIIVQGSKSQSVIVRGLGPSLPSAQVPNPLADPTLDLYDANGTLIEHNDNWQDSSEANEIANARLAPSNAREAAIEQPLPAGNYTAIVKGNGNGTGVGLVEVYMLP